MSMNYGSRRDRPRVRLLNEETESEKYKRLGWDPRKTCEENMGYEGVFDRPDEELDWPDVAPQQRRKPTRQVRELAAEGRGGDTEIAHVANGEFVIPREFLTPELLTALSRIAAAHGVPLERLIVGNARNRINPNTGAPEFAFDELTPEMEDIAARAANMPIPIDPLADGGLSHLSDYLVPPQDSAMRPNWTPPSLVPTQYMSAVPMPAPEEKIFDDPRMMPSFRSQAIASLPTNRETQKQALAGAVFPGAKYADIKDRMFENDGRIGYTDWDGSKYYAEPAPKLPTSGANIDETIKWAGSNVGPLMTGAGGMAGGMIGELFGPAGAYRGAIAGAAGADAARQYAANKLAGEQKPWSDRLLQTGGAAADELLDIDNFLDWTGRPRQRGF